MTFMSLRYTTNGIFQSFLFKQEKFFSTFEDKRNSQNAKNVFDDYPKVKSLSIWAIRISVAALILSLVKLIAELLR